MSLKWFETKTPGGTAVLRLEASGTVSADEAQRLMEAIGPGTRYQSWPKLGFAETGTNISPEARKIFAGDPNNRPTQAAPTAIVLTSAVMRVTVGFIVRMGSGGATRMFATEAEATAWLDKTVAA